MIRSRSVLIILIMTISSSCSMRRLLINHADWLAMYELDRYFDLNREQKATLKPVVKDTLNWIRVERGPDINQYLDDCVQIWLSGPTEDKILDLRKRYDAFRVDLISKIAPEASKFLSSLSSDQLDHLSKKLAKSNDDLEELVELPAEKFEKKQRKRLLKNLNDWIDDLSDEQEEAFLKDFPIDQAGFQTHVLGRKTAQSNFVEYLRNQKSQDEIERSLRQWALSPNLLRNEPENSTRSGRMSQVILTTYRIATPAQRRQVAENIQKVQRDLKFSDAR